MKSIFTNIVIAVTLLISGSILAGDDGTRSPFNLGAGAADLSQGGANLAYSDTWTAPYWNPSRLARAERYSLGGFHSRLYDEGVAYQYLGLVIPTLDWGCFGLGVFRLSIDGIEKRDLNNIYIEDIEDSQMAFYIAYGRKVSGYDIGLAVNLEHHSLDSYSAVSSPGLTLSAGRTWPLNISRLRELALVINGRNILRPSMKLVEESISYPYAADLGASIKIYPHPDWDHEVILSVAATKVDYLDLRVALGIEYNFQNLLYLRGGLREEKASFGAGLRYKAISFDYALVDRDMGSLHMFSLVSAFGMPTGEKKIQRARRQEAEFNNIMNDHLKDHNRQMISDLVRQGDHSFEEGDLSGAGNYYDRALFLARNSEVDTAAIHQKADEVQKQLENIMRMQRYGQFMDSAQYKFDNEDYIAARYFANLATAEVPNSTQAQEILNRADRAIRAASSQEELVEKRLWQVDSLLNYGQLDRALTVIKTLVEFAPDHSGVRLARKRVEFERLREAAVTTYAREDLNGTLVILDSALALFPNHQWWLDFHVRVEKEMKKQRQVTVASDEIKPQAAPLSPEVKKEVEDAYRTAQDHFKKGNLAEAIKYWEQVERLAPDYQSVRDYLVNAYKYVGVELYSQNQLRDAIDVWKKASRINPANEEIIKYINRTENEIRKLEELSYESN
ncbi:MAG: hypothetical protein JXA92_05525 [candidate division Zixibacteria bacterium]|nr:hypothetical protein [candidate division Zixibacteria bacterium]